MSDFVSVLKTADLSPGEMKVITLGEDEVVIANVEGRFFAFSNICPHEGGPLGEGHLEGECVTCPWHNTRFEIKSGKAIEGVTDDPVPTCDVRIEGDDVQVRLHDAAPKKAACHVNAPQD